MKNRLEHIREQVKNEKKVTVSELSKIYKVTEETIRRDLEKLEKEGFLTRTFGGAVLNSASQKEHIHFYKRTSINQKEKAKIAQLFKGSIRSEENDSSRCQYNCHGSHSFTEGKP